ncbi:hypothetical protein [Micropruina sp.]|uniref:hypothetical protein n=1 Tax=Micropruina sp. TaxID=2737536 RepID=UPI0039E6FBFB
MSWPAPTGDPIRPAMGAASPSGDQAPGTDHHSPTGQQVGTLPPPAPLPPPSSDSTTPAPTTAGGIQTLAPTGTQPGLARLSEKTGQPVRPWTIWAAAVFMFGGAIAVTVGLLIAMWAMASPWVEVADGWTKDDKFNEATWLTAQFPSEPASGWRVFFAIVCCLIAVIVAGTVAVIGYYAFAGYGWTRIGALVALAVSLLSLLITPIAALSIGLVALGAGALWLPPTAPFFNRWHLVRHPVAAYSEPVENVFYGPLPRYR